MKLFTIITFCILNGLIAETKITSETDRLNEEKELELQQVQLWETNLEKSEKMSDHEKLDFLWLGLRNMGFRRNHSLPSSEIDRIYFKIQDAILSIPGHAQHFADWLETERIKSLDPSYIGQYGRVRYMYLHDILMNLPSPETVQVLGHYLGDDRDTTPQYSGQDGRPYPANLFIATRALMDIGINDSPVPIQVKPWEQRALDLQRAWWEEVKSGKRSFSFYGQNVEFRFSPEGEVLTTPRDGSKDPEPLDRDNSRRSQQKKPVYTSPAFWGIAAGGIFVYLAVGWWLRVRYQRLQIRSVCL